MKNNNISGRQNCWMLWHVVKSQVLLMACCFLFCFLDTIVQWDLGITNLGGWYCLFVSSISRFIFLWAFSLVFGRLFTRYIFIGLFLWMALILVIEWIVRLNFNMLLSGDWIMFVNGTSHDEIMSFISEVVNFKSIASITVVAILLTATLVVLKRGSLILWRPWSAFVGIILVFLSIASLGLNPFLLSGWERFTDGFISKFIVTDTFRNRNKFQRIVEVHKNPVFPSGIISCSISDKPLVFS